MTLSSLKARILSPLKVRTSSPLKVRTCSPLKERTCSPQGVQPYEKSRDWLIERASHLKLKRLDIRFRKSMQLTWLLGMQMHATFVLKCSKFRLCMQQYNVMEKLYNVHDILSLFCDFDFDLIFWKTQIDCSFERGDNSWNLILSFANLFGNSLRVYVLSDLVTWQFWGDDNGVV